jgi:hypothetical protein
VQAVVTLLLAAAVIYGGYFWLTRHVVVGLSETPNERRSS